MSDEFKEDFLMHYGTPRHSGRYPWGSGKKPQRSKNFVSRVDYWRAQGKGDTEIARMEGISTTEFRKRLSIAANESKRADIAMAQRLKEKGMSNVAIGKRMNRNESYVRTLLKDGAEVKANRINATADILKDSVDKKDYVDVGAEVNRFMGISENTMKSAVKMLVDSGDYDKVQLHIPQISNPLQKTNMDVLVKAGVTQKEVYDNMDKIALPVEYMVDGDPKERRTIKPPVQVDPKRVSVVYAEDGGLAKDGVMELRRGVPDLDMGNSRYAQVRIAVGGTHYIKGMAVYADDLPDGVDIRFNTNKHRGTPMMGEKDNTVLKLQSGDKDNPFGAYLERQNSYKNEKGEKVQGALNIVREEGKWGEWAKTLASQVLSKQPIELAKKQLNLAKAESDEEFETIMNLTNPVLKKKMLLEFADGCDADAVDLKAAALPRQAAHVLLPLTTLKDNEIYAPNYKDGEEVVLVRFPHGGRFEMPRLRVNNKNKEGASVMGANAIDAVGINSKTAEQLSGADFDGDTALVIPTKNVKIKTSAPLEGLKNFDPKAMYGYHEGMRVMTKADTGKQMGMITNLITDMTLQGADDNELARATRHSMVVIDANKHRLDYEQSYIDNGIAELKTKYQGSARGGAATLLSKAKSPEYVYRRERKGQWIDEETGEIKWTEHPETVTKTKVLKNGEVRTSTKPYKPVESTKMYETKDAYSLSSGHEMEEVYADYANYMKALGNRARKASLSVEPAQWNRGATTLAYKDEIVSLDKKLDDARRNAPLERKAQLIANQTVRTKKQENPELKDDKEALKKVKNNALRDAREVVGAKRQAIVLSDREWEAIQAGAISATKQEAIFKNCDDDALKERAMPRTSNGLTTANKARIMAMLDAGWTTSDIAEKFDVSTSTISAVKKEGA